MEFTGAELDILHALTRQESNQLDKNMGSRLSHTHGPPGAVTNPHSPGTAATILFITSSSSSSN